MNWISGSSRPVASSNREGGIPHPPQIRASAIPLTDWEGEICQCFSRHQKFTLDLAKIVSAAKKALLRGQWTQLWKSSGRLPFAIRKGEMLAAVGENLGNLNAHMCARLPVGWTVLYQLARLPRLDLEKLIADQVVHPGITWSAANALMARFVRPNSKGALRPKLKLRLRSFKKFVLASAGDWSHGERRMVCETLQVLVRQLTAEPATPVCSSSFSLSPQPTAWTPTLHLTPTT